MKNTIILLTMLLFSGIGFAQESNNGKQLWAKSFLNEKAPELTVETWISKIRHHRLLGYLVWPLPESNSRAQRDCQRIFERCRRYRHFGRTGRKD